MPVCPHTHRHTHTDIGTHNDISSGPVFPFLKAMEMEGGLSFVQVLSAWDER